MSASSAATGPRFIQKIYFGSPGTGKSYKIETKDLQDLGIQKNSENHFHAVFHPEYTYGDFVGKLVPLTKSGKVEYKYRAGHFLKALGKAYKNIRSDPASPQNVAPVIDELNRGNSAAIFGTVFQLLDRDENGWSSYAVTLGDIEFDALISEMGYRIATDENGNTIYINQQNQKEKTNFDEDLKKVNDGAWSLSLNTRTVKLPPNLSLIATINTSDNSVYLMDSAFKRRWDWEFVAWDKQQDKQERVIDEIKPNNNFQWPHNDNPVVCDGSNNFYRWAPIKDTSASFIRALNRIIKSHHESVRGIEDKQLGPLLTVS